ncbi:MAG: 2-phosphosulfolactate phosphatase, partial [Actinomycetota bacterium]|nr:2-phosphosulfolactate phosphatase [Actinomycetota bacterium]
VLAGSLLNLKAVAAAIPPQASVGIVCAGTGGRFSLDDAFVAGRFVQLLAGERSDAARVAERLAEAYPDPAEALGDASHAQSLRATGQASDIGFCARESVLDVVPGVESVEEGVAAVVPWSKVNGPSNTDSLTPMNQAKTLN